MPKFYFGTTQKPTVLVICHFSTYTELDEYVIAEPSRAEGLVGEAVFRDFMMFKEEGRQLGTPYLRTSLRNVIQVPVKSRHLECRYDTLK